MVDETILYFLKYKNIENLFKIGITYFSKNLEYSIYKRYCQETGYRNINNFEIIGGIKKNTRLEATILENFLKTKYYKFRIGRKEDFILCNKNIIKEIINFLRINILDFNYKKITMGKIMGINPLDFIYNKKYNLQDLYYDKMTNTKIHIFKDGTCGIDSGSSFLKISDNINHLSSSSIKANKVFREHRNYLLVNNIINDNIISKNIILPSKDFAIKIIRGKSTTFSTAVHK